MSCLQDSSGSHKSLVKICELSCENWSISCSISGSHFLFIPSSLSLVFFSVLKSFLLYLTHALYFFAFFPLSSLHASLNYTSFLPFLSMLVLFLPTFCSISLFFTYLFILLFVSFVHCIHSRKGRPLSYLILLSNLFITTLSLLFISLFNILHSLTYSLFIPILYTSLFNLLFLHLFFSHSPRVLICFPLSLTIRYPW